MANQFELTPEGFARLTAELEALKSFGRKRVAEQIKETKQFGDFLDSSEYEAAKAEQARRGREWGLANTRPQDAVYEVSESGVWLRRVA